MSGEKRKIIMIVYKPFDEGRGGRLIGLDNKGEIYSFIEDGRHSEWRHIHCRFDGG